ncbi:hypothetical protein [Anoxybacillus sp. J5B_2022]|uniref:hypothetical protein n=1 Tax=Anoxybacillus sp. J5B_2022 TaxID=3003246 RepID=UPI0005426E75|nr:hypothetical protein [Anoxybacillus sp. J5B_2022]KHF27059.1 hypothetical protein LR68_04107 [Anoxybacillus sp. BCO1]MCZ0756059.1 hypothetical protein [Anoxybacillus sp. J5B_2022]
MDDKKRRMIEKEEEITSGSGIWSGYSMGNDPSNEYSVKYLSRAAEKICDNRVKWRDIIILFSDSSFGEGKSGFVLSTDGIYVKSSLNKHSKFSVQYSDIDFVFYDTLESKPVLKIYTKYDDCKIIDHPWFNLEVLCDLIDAMKEIADEYDNLKLEW